ncbi:Cys/Met metabolism pyridoxal-phosphate-dependent protein [Gemmatirosa kalamazoonensis]|uniref:Cys/Met metabolism pyridoxal-phosphate-dependent protein n=1 Tax=Gemmatirosa kalamazoonensis TaxID=861299 RepID=W0RLV7_9BACT|nr:aminotransferase class I/II-fold pyridoxal phosphate-dependent enzyme [Gemmatirosa kalamazoonensis]AHG91295.1 Cys/Met metabolism pyridoxal-phosphate-dependent protein [Gemmatirosa kalamazoonensis]
MDTSSAPAAVTPGFSTVAVHGARVLRDDASDGAERPAGRPVVTPLVQSVNFTQPFGTEDGLRYTRYGNVPNAESVQTRLALLEGAEAALVCASGMGATACTMLALLRPGDHLLSSAWIYGGTHKLFTQELPAFGVEVTFVDPTKQRDWRRSVRKTTRAVFVESPVNPTTRVLDLRPLARMSSELGLALVVDSTFASPINFRPLEHGADVVIHSATKYLNGHHDVLGGAVAGAASVIEEVRQKMIVWGQAPDPFACWLLERGMKTLDVRVRRQSENAQRLAEWCESRGEIARVLYPGLPSHPDHDVARDTLDGFGGMMAIELEGGGEAAERFVKRLRVITHAPSLGGVDSLVSEPRYTSHAHLTVAERAKAGVPDGFLRISVGIENVEDLIADVEQALA